MFKKQLIAITLTLACALAAGADSALERPFLPVSPEVLAQGGSFTANAAGYNALFYNPAAFAAPRRSLTLSSSTLWLYANPYRTWQALKDPGASSLAGFLEDEITSGGFGLGFAQGIGYVGKGLGLAAVLNVDSYLWGPTTLGAEGQVSFTLGFIGGLAVPLSFGPFKLSVGADIRPMIRILAPLDYTVMLDMLESLQSGGDPLQALRSAPALHGYAFGLDLGMIAELGGLRLGLAVRDFLGTRFTYTENLFGDILDSLEAAEGFPDGGPAVDGHLIPMDISAGISYRFNLGPLVDPVLHASLNDVVGVIREQRSPWTLLHLGTEITLLRALRFRAGLNQGYLTFGAGIKLWILDLNAAVFTREAGKHMGDRPNSGMTVEAALRL